MAVKIKAGSNWYKSSFALYQGPEGSGEPFIPFPEEKADGLVLKKGSNQLVVKFLVNIGGELITLLTNWSTTVVGMKDLLPDVHVAGQVMKDVVGSKQSFVLIGKDAVFQSGKKGNPDYLKIENQIEFSGKFIG